MGLGGRLGGWGTLTCDVGIGVWGVDCVDGALGCILGTLTWVWTKRKIEFY
jgi:hypothetical protein